MAKQHIRFAKLALGYFGVLDISPEDFSGFLKDWSKSNETVLDAVITLETLDMLLAMIFKSRHRLKKDLLDPEFDRVAFFVEYQLNLPLDRTSPDSIFAGLFQGLPKELYKEISDSSLDMTAMFTPRPSPWTQPGVFGKDKVELSHEPLRHEPLPKPNLLPKPTHKAPSTLQ